MILGIEVKKRLNGAWFNFPAAEFNGMTARQILVFIDRQDMIIKIDQGMEKSVYIVGKEQTLAEYSGNRKHAFMTVKEALERWNNSPLMCIVWPPFSIDAPVPNGDSESSLQEIIAELASYREAVGKQKAPGKRMRKAA